MKINEKMDLTSMHKRIYQLWYEFLKRSDPKKWDKDAVKPYFQNLNKEPFSSWWKAYGKDLNIPAHSGCQVIQSAKEFKEYDEDIGVIVWFQLAMPKKKLLQSLSKIIDQAILNSSQDIPTKRVGAPKFKEIQQSIDLPLAAATTEKRIATLRTMLKVYDSCLAADKAKKEGRSYKKRYQIGVELNINSKDIIAGNDLDASAKKQSMNSAVGRYNRWAHEVISNAEKGIFPKHSRW